MKKLFSALTLLVLILGLTGCASTQELEGQIDDLTAQVNELNGQILVYEDRIPALESINEGNTEEIEELEAQIEELEAQIAALQALIFDNTITFQIVDADGVSNATVGYNDDFEGTLFDLLDSELEVGYSESEYGKYIYSLESLNPSNGSYIAFFKNGEPSMVGVETATYEDGDVFSFEISWYDATEEAVFNAIELFIAEQASNYVNATTIDYNVLVALDLMGVLENYVTKAEVEAYVGIQNPSTVQDYFKLIVMLEAVDSDTSAYYTALNNNVTVGAYGQTAFGLLGLDAGTHTEDYSVYVASALSDLDTTTPYDLGLDAGGISLVALSNYQDETGVDTLISDFVDWIKLDQLESGGIKTRDITWGETVYPGTENAASMSQVILGLVANGIDPTGTEFTKANGDLVSRLCEYQTATGSFDWDLTDDIDEDLAFSTPQAFLALVTYYTYSNTFAAVNPYNFNE
jgi:outer membrane murein-binding lipoprotein Lpp